MKRKRSSAPRNSRKSSQSKSTEPVERGLCRFAFSDGRHCRMPRWKHHPEFCFTHACKERQLLAELGTVLRSKRALAANAARVARELASFSGGFRTSGDVNHVLGKLFALLAQGRIPRRNAVALAYIGQLLIQTLPNVRKEVQSTHGDHVWLDMLEAAYGDPKPSGDESFEDDMSDDAPRDESDDEPRCAPQMTFPDASGLRNGS